MNYPQEKIKPYNADEKKSVQVEKMFDNIAPAYDQLNHALSWNIDKSWRRKAINWLKPFHPQHIMDGASKSHLAIFPAGVFSSGWKIFMLPKTMK